MLGVSGWTEVEVDMEVGIRFESLTMNNTADGMSDLFSTRFGFDLTRGCIIRT